MNTIYVDKYVTNISQLCVWEDTKQIWANIDKALRKYPYKSLGVQYFEWPCLFGCIFLEYVPLDTVHISS